MCSALNSNCKWNGSFFKCVCKEKYLAVNATHCGQPMSNIEEQKCRECLERDSLCLDFDNDRLTDECWCPKNETCGGSVGSGGGGGGGGSRSKESSRYTQYIYNTRVPANNVNVINIVVLDKTRGRLETSSCQWRCSTRATIESSRTEVPCLSVIKFS